MFLLLLWLFYHAALVDGQPEIEIEHAYGDYVPTLSPEINGSDVTMPPTDITPDFRVETRLPGATGTSYMEEHRPYRISPHKKQVSKWWNREDAHLLGCYCTTVYKRLRVLAGCAVITTRHVLTTATSVELILRKRRHFRSFENILGLWYDINSNTYNSSMYATPAQIHYHPRYTRPKDVNRSHPFPANFDLSVWTATYRFYGSAWTISKACICNRASSHKWEYAPPTFRPGEMSNIVDFQFIRAYKRKPMPWFKYAVRTRTHTHPCPKLEWGWFLCVPSYWAPLGIGSGAALHRVGHNQGWRYDGLLGLNAISLQLRSIYITNYFVVLDRHNVLEFLYDAYMGRAKYEWLDVRFEQDPVRKEVKLKSGYYVPWNYPFGEEKFYGHKFPVF